MRHSAQQVVPLLFCQNNYRKHITKSKP
jgi:hypothetical protein